MENSQSESRSSWRQRLRWSRVRKSAVYRIQRLTAQVSRLREREDAAAYFAGKKVVILGPSCQVTEPLVRRVQAADALVVVNKGHRARTFIELRPHAREIVLFHCLDLSEESGGGDLESWELRRKGFKGVFYPLHESRFEENVATYHRRNHALLPLHRLPRESYEALRDTIQRFTPNTGYAAIWTIARGGCTSLYVTGMNFLRIPYQASYHAHLADLGKAIAFIERYGNHNPDKDLESFRVLREQCPIEVDEALADILSRPTTPMFYLNQAGKGSTRDGVA